jgi:hypothetical protein
MLSRSRLKGAALATVEAQAPKAPSGPPGRVLAKEARIADMETYLRTVPNTSVVEQQRGKTFTDDVLVPRCLLEFKMGSKEVVTIEGTGEPKFRVKEATRMLHKLNSQLPSTLLKTGLEQHVKREKGKEADLNQHEFASFFSDMQSLPNVCGDFRRACGASEGSAAPLVMTPAQLQNFLQMVQHEATTLDYCRKLIAYYGTANEKLPSCSSAFGPGTAESKMLLSLRSRRVARNLHFADWPEPGTIKMDGGKDGPDAALPVLFNAAEKSGGIRAIKSGMLTKFDPLNNTRGTRFVELHSTVITSYGGKEADSRGALPKHILNLDKNTRLTAETVTTGSTFRAKATKFALVLNAHTTSVQLEFDTEGERDQWMQAVTKQVRPCAVAPVRWCWRWRSVGGATAAPASTTYLHHLLYPHALSSLSPHVVTISTLPG